MANLVYFSNVSENTRRFVEKLAIPSERIPIHGVLNRVKPRMPFLLITPTYGSGEPRSAVPRQVMRFLNEQFNRSALRGVIAAGNASFGASYGLAGDVIGAKCDVPVLYRFELAGLPTDVARVEQGFARFQLIAEES